MAGVPELSEIAATVSRMEARYGTTPEANRLMTAYRRISKQFTADLSDPRDLALAKSAALMMVAALVADGPT